LRLGVGVGKSARGVGGGQLMTTASAYDSQKFQLFQQQALGCQKAYVKLLSIQPRLPDWEMAGKCPACLNWSSYTYLKVAGQQENCLVSFLEPVILGSNKCRQTEEVRLLTEYILFTHKSDLLRYQRKYTYFVLDFRIIPLIIILYCVLVS